MLCRITWLCFHDILRNFQKATGLQINKEKSIFYHNEISQEMVHWLSALFGVKSHSIKQGIKYLGFQLKANSHSKNDWQWIIDGYHKKISLWEFRCLSLAGRVILAQSVLNQITIYWAHLFFLPASVIKKMDKITANFIWGGQAERRKFHLSKLSGIFSPKSMGGWGLLNLHSFGKALLVNRFGDVFLEKGPGARLLKRNIGGGRFFFMVQGGKDRPLL